MGSKRQSLTLGKLCKVQGFDLVIVRAYASFPSEGGGVDRYITLHNYAKKNRIRSLLCVSNYHHNKKSYRDLSDIGTEEVVLINAGEYKSNLSIQRLIYELKFAYKSYKVVKKNGAKSVLIGEPLFLGWIFFFWLKCRKGTIIFGDFIDLMPEAYMIKFRSKLLFWLIFWPFYLSRLVRVKFLYDKVFTVSQSYADLILRAPKREDSVFYWGVNAVNKSKIFGHIIKVVYAGSLGDGYDIETLIELGKSRPDLKVVIAGSGPKSDLCRHAHEQGFITFLGQIGAIELDNLYQDATYGVLPYKRNSAVSMPIKFYEYLVHRLIIINSLSMECSELINRYKLGCNYLPGSVLSMGDAIDRSSNICIPEGVVKDLEQKYSVESQYKSFVSVIGNYIKVRNNHEKML
ncbi:glycosyltransferase [Polynucleobacter asymbioticus]|uniref:glycosyltransferase n=1 Tax=Polynucleobacter asymbioticus TaxID=576611 RepID=UPI001160B5F2|nr:glycosyltransferase [Polynucleobacter asymbioticus]